MRKLLSILALLAVVPIAAAQYAPNTSQQYGAGYSFQPLGKTAYLSASTTSASIALSAATNQYQVANTTAGWALVIFCASSTCTAAAGSASTSTTDYPVAPGAVIVVSVPVGTTYVAAVLSTGSGTVYITPGVGL